MFWGIKNLIKKRRVFLGLNITFDYSTSFTASSLGTATIVSVETKKLSTFNESGDSPYIYCPVIEKMEYCRWNYVLGLQHNVTEEQTKGDSH
jgi:hypothetical protein